MTDAMFENILTIDSDTPYTEHFTAALTDYGRLRGIPIWDFTVARGEHGKPYFETPPLRDVHFSVSHSGDIWAVLFGDRPLGFDVEDARARGSSDADSICDIHDKIGAGIAGTRREKRSVERLLNIAERFFAPDELRALHSAPDPAAYFYFIWTGKEAWMKYTGEGLTRRLSGFSVIEAQADPGLIFHSGTLSESVYFSMCCAGDDNGRGMENAYLYVKWEKDRT